LTRSIGEFLSVEILGRLPHAGDLAPEEAARRTGLVASQLLGLIIGRYVLRLPALADRTSADLVSEVGPTIQRYLDPPSP
jgi:hypothetical protein